MCLGAIGESVDAGPRTTQPVSGVAPVAGVGHSSRSSASIDRELAVVVEPTEVACVREAVIVDEIAGRLVAPEVARYRPSGSTGLTRP